MKTSIRSHAFFVGNLPYNVMLKNIDSTQWKEIIEEKEDYVFLCSYFHKSHVDAMIRTKGQKRPKFLDNVRHYMLEINKAIQLSLFNEKMKKLTVLDGYNMVVKGLHIYQFPLDITLYAIEIDDSGSSLNDLTLAHSAIRELPSKWNEFNNEFKETLKPLINLVPSQNLNDLVASGNKLKIFQLLMVNSNDWSDEHLYAIATCSAIDIVGANKDLSPSTEYYNSIMQNNTIAPFQDWKALSLMDTYTGLIKSKDEFDEEHWSRTRKAWNCSYYRLIYLRALAKKTFLSRQNDRYRLDIANSRLVHDLNKMEQYYFYDNISYNFLPNMLNAQMEKSLEIKEERNELSSQIKESDDKNANRLATTLSAFAVFSVAYDILNIVKAINEGKDVIMHSIFGGIATIIVILLIIRTIRRN